MNVEEIKLLLENETFLNEMLKFNDYRFHPDKITQLEAENIKMNDVLNILDFISNNLNWSAKVKMDLFT